MSDHFKKLSVTLTEEEAAALKAEASGGHQKFQQSLQEQLADGKLTLELKDVELGKIVRYMSQAGSQGLQGRLKTVFKRPLLEMLAKRGNG